MKKNIFIVLIILIAFSGCQFNNTESKPTNEPSANNMNIKVTSVNQSYLEDSLYCENDTDCTYITVGECCDFEIMNEYYRLKKYGSERKGTWTCEMVCPLESGEITINCVDNQCSSNK